MLLLQFFSSAAILTFSLKLMFFITFFLFFRVSNFLGMIQWKIEDTLGLLTWRWWRNYTGALNPYGVIILHASNCSRTSGYFYYERNWSEWKNPMNSGTFSALYFRYEVNLLRMLWWHFVETSNGMIFIHEWMHPGFRMNVTCGVQRKKPQTPNTILCWWLVDF